MQIIVYSPFSVIPCTFFVSNNIPDITSHSSKEDYKQTPCARVRVTVKSQCSGFILNPTAHGNRSVVGVLLTFLTYALFRNFHADFNQDMTSRIKLLLQRKVKFGVQTTVSTSQAVPLHNCWFLCF